jgi:hypothetical protein
MVRINQSSSPPMLVLQLGLRADDPAGRARMYYVDITGYLFDKNVSASSSHPSSDCIVSFRVKDKVVAQQKAVVASVNIKAQRTRNMDGSYFDLLTCCTPAMAAPSSGTSRCGWTARSSPR